MVFIYLGRDNMENVVDDRESEILYNKEKWIGTINSLMERNGWGIKDLS